VDKTVRDRPKVQAMINVAESTIAMLLSDILNEAGWSDIEVIVPIDNLAKPTKGPDRLQCRAIIVGKL
jgi:hypothetical protein